MCSNPSCTTHEEADDPPRLSFSDTFRAKYKASKDSDWVAGSYYSTLELEGHREGSIWQLFNYSRSQAIPESQRLASQWHTNMPRSGDCGLPQGWSALINGWRISTNIAISTPPLKEWADKTYLSFVYNNKRYFGLPLSDFVNRTVHKETDAEEAQVYSQNLYDKENFSELNVHLQEFLSFRVDVESDISATKNLREWLRFESQDGVALARLEELIESLPYDQNKSRFRAAFAGLNHSKTFSLRVHLCGAIKRVIY